MGIFARLENRLAGYVRHLVNAEPDRRLSFPFTAGAEQAGGGVANTIINLVRNRPGAHQDHDLQLFMYFLLREHVPIINSAIGRRRDLEGEMVLDSEDDGLLRALIQFSENLVTGNVLGENQPIIGLEAGVNEATSNVDTYGLGAGEPEFDEAGQDVERLLLPNPRQFKYKRANSNLPWELHQRLSTGVEVAVEGSNVYLMGFERTPENPWPLPMHWGLPFVSEVAIRMIISINHLWFRAGDPSQLYTVSYDKETDVSPTTIDADIDALKKTVAGVLKTRAKGKVADGFIGFKGGSIQQLVMGGNAIVGSLAPYFQEHYNSIAGQIIGRSDVPEWLFPEVESTGEGMGSERSNLQNDLAISAANRRNRTKARFTRNVINTWLLVTKSARFIERYSVRWEPPNLRDLKAEEETRNTHEQANMGAIENAQTLADLGLIKDEERRDYVERAGVLEPAM